MRKLLGYSCLKGITLDEPGDGLPHEFIEKWLTLLRDQDTQWPTRSAKPIHLDDYQQLGTMLKIKYLGATHQQSDSEPELQKDVPGKTVFHTVAWDNNGDVIYAT